MHPFERETALDICEFIKNSTHFVTEQELRRSMMRGGYCDTIEYEAGLSLAQSQRWVRPARARPTLTLTLLGQREITQPLLPQR
jgi:hypothetical protein